MGFSKEYQEKIERITQMVWKSFIPPSDEYLEICNKRFLQKAEKLAYEDFWTGTWRDLPLDDDGLVFYLQQYWLHEFDRIIDSEKEEKE